MNNIVSSRVRSDFNRVRFEAFLSRIWANLTGKPAELLSFDEVREQLRIGGLVSRGVIPVKLEQITGSLNRHHEFDRVFRPFHSVSSERWQSVDRAFYEGIPLPAVVLYKVGEVYFVVDGHHRISVARKQGQVFIDAEVREYRVHVSITPELITKDLERLCAAPT